MPVAMVVGDVTTLQKKHQFSAIVVFWSCSRGDEIPGILFKEKAGMTW